MTRQGALREVGYSSLSVNRRSAGGTARMELCDLYVDPTAGAVILCGEESGSVNLPAQH